MYKRQDRYAAATRSSDSASDSRRALAAYQAAVDARSSGPAARTRRIAAARSCGEADGATNPLTPSSISSVAALSGSATTTLGVPAAHASTTTSP